MNDHVVSAPEADAPQTGIAEYSATERGLAELRQRLAQKVYDVKSTKGLDEARKDRAECRSLRVALEAKRKEIKAPALDFCRRIDSEAKRITEEIESLEEPIDAQIKAEEIRKEEERQERARAEAERLRHINEAIASLQRLPLEYMSANAAELQAAIDDLTGDTLDQFDEIHLPSAQAAKDASLTKLREMLDARVAADTEAERLAAERAELERLRAADDERRQQETEAARAAELVAEHIADLRAIPSGLVTASSEILRGAIAEVETIDPCDPRFGSRRADADAAKVATLARLHEMLDASTERERIAAEQAERQRQLDEQAAAQKRAQEEAEARARAEQEARGAAERAERERLEAEAAERHRQQEEDAIQKATWREALHEAHAVLCELGYGNHITARKIAAVLAKESQS